MRERLIVYGDCQAQALHGILRRSRQITEAFAVELHFAGEQAQAWPVWKEAIRGAAAVFIQDIPQSRAHPSYDIPWQTRPRLITFPALSFPSLWPFSTAFGGRDAVAEALRAAVHGTGLHSDALLGALRCVPDHGARLAAFLALRRDVSTAAAKLIARRDPRRIHELDSFRLREMDERNGSNLGRYILHNFRDRRLFHIMRHPAVELTRMIGVELFQKYDRSVVELDTRIDDNECYQVPIHPIVAEALDVRWVKPDSRYRVFNDELSIEEYTLRYMELYG